MSFDDEETPPKNPLYASDADGTGIGLVGNDLAPKPHAQSRQMLAGRVLANGAGENVSRHTHGLHACTFEADAQLEWPVSSLARPG